MKKIRFYLMIVAIFLIASYSHGQVNVTAGATTSNTVTGSEASAIGTSNTASGSYSCAIGNGNTSSSTCAFTAGKSNTATDYYSLAMGYGSDATEMYTTAIGRDCEASANYATALGYYAKSSGNTSFSLGKYAYAGSTGAFAIGTYVEAKTNNFAMAIGQGASILGKLTNTIGSSLAIGFNSDIPTFFVSTASGTGTLGKIGIGTTSPGALLDVRGDAIFNEDGTDNDFRVEGDTRTHLLFADAGTDAVSVRTSVTTYDFNLDGTAYLKGHVGIDGIPDATYELKVWGDAYATVGWYSSDKRFKRNINNIDNALDKIIAINGKKYEFRTDEFENRNFSEGTNYGFVAQELEQIVPELVSQDEDGYYAINYNGVIPILVEAIKAQQDQINELQNILEAGNTLEYQNDIESASTNLLHQNKPNPFNELTEIQYTLKNDVQSAKIMIFDMNGTNLKTYKVDVSANGKLTINANELKPGMYIYSLITDDKEVGTKRMIITE